MTGGNASHSRIARNLPLARQPRLREYGAVNSIPCYIIVASASIGMMVLDKQSDGSWKARCLTGGDVREMPELGVSVPVMEFYHGVITEE